MADINEYREEINRIDGEMAKLFEQRMKICREIGIKKKELALPVKDKNREDQVIKNSRELIEDAEIKPYYVSFQKKNIELSCNLQTKIMEGMKVGYSGVPGAYAYIAAKKMYPDANLISYANFEPAYQAALNGDVDCVVLPLENSYAGDVGAAMDLAFSGNLFVNRMCSLEIEHVLAVLPGAEMKDIKTVVSHGQALQQCDEFIKEKNFATIEYSNTARAAEHVKEAGDKSVAAICSEEAAKLAGLQIIVSKVNTSDTNTSRFGVFSLAQNFPDPYAKNDQYNFIIAFTAPNEAGSLAMILDIIGAHGYNMKNLKSRPRKGLMWKYYFYVECEGNIASQSGQDMMRELSALSSMLKLIGVYGPEEQY